MSAHAAAPAGLPVRVEGLVHIYRLFDTEVVALRGVDLTIAAGETVTLFGPSGSGKSTLLAALSGLVRPSAGTVRIGDAEIGRMSERELLRLRRGRVATLLQGAGRNLLPYASPAQNVAFAQRGTGRRHRADAAADLLAGLDLGHLADAPLAALSGGELQRVAIAAAVAGGPGLLLADEPTSQLDAAGRDAVISTLQRVNERFGTTVVAVTHDREVGARLGRQVVMRAGRVGEEGRGDERFVVVGADGALHLPHSERDAWPAGTLVEVRRDGDDLRLVRRQR